MAHSGRSADRGHPGHIPRKQADPLSADLPYGVWDKPGKKAKSLKISDRRKLSLLNVDFKLLTGIEAACIRATMHKTISPLQLVSGALVFRAGTAENVSLS